MFNYPQNIWTFPFPQCSVIWLNGHSSFWRRRGNHYHISLTWCYRSSSWWPCPSLANGLCMSRLKSGNWARASLLFITSWSSILDVFWLHRLSNPLDGCPSFLPQRHHILLSPSICLSNPATHKTITITNGEALSSGLCCSSSFIPIVIRERRLWPAFLGSALACRGELPPSSSGTMCIPRCCSKQRFLKSLVQNMIIWCFLALLNKATPADPFPESFNSLFYSVLWQFRPFYFTCCGPSLFPASNSMLAPYPRILDRLSNLISRKVPLYPFSSLHNFIFSSLRIQPHMYSLNFC